MQIILKGYDDGKHQFIFKDGSSITGYILNLDFDKTDQYFYFNSKNIFDYVKFKSTIDYNSLMNLCNPIDIKLIESAVKLKSGYTTFKR